MTAVAQTHDEALRAPFPWFGGKRRIAPLVWERFGDVASYNEPFAGSLAVLLGRPTAPRIETVNDLDLFISNFWRAVQADPAAVAKHADSPVNEADLHARHRWLVETGRALVQRCLTDPHFFEPMIAGWWVWGQCLWIGSGWCEARTGPANIVRPELFTGGRGIHRKRFRGDGETGVQAERARRWQGGGQAGGSGIHAKRFASTGHGQGTGVHSLGTAAWRQRPDISGDGGASGRGIHASSAFATTEGLYHYFEALAARLRRVRVCCGDWRRVLTPSVSTYIGVTGVLLDPPYSHDLRTRCYAEDHDISAEVRAWALEHGDDPLFRIALCGYEGEHEMPASWTCVPWKAHGGYSRSARGVANRQRERVWFSPHCLNGFGPLFARGGA